VIKGSFPSGFDDIIKTSINFCMFSNMQMALSQCVYLSDFKFPIGGPQFIVNSHGNSLSLSLSDKKLGELTIIFSCRRAFFELRF